jgi:hypothetical protein
VFDRSENNKTYRCDQIGLSCQFMGVTGIEYGGASTGWCTLEMDHTLYLALPRIRIFHVIYNDFILRWLVCLCKKLSRFVLDDRPVVLGGWSRALSSNQQSVYSSVK